MNISEFHLRMDVIQRNLPKTFGMIVVLFLLLQLIAYFSKFEIHLVARSDEDTVVLEYEYVDEDGKENEGLDYDALDHLAQEQAQYNYRYRYSMDNPQKNGTSKGGKADTKVHPNRRREQYPPVERTCTMEERLVHMRRYCDRDKTIDDTFQHKDLLVDEKHQVLYCSIPRVAATSWRTVMAKVTGNVAQNITWPPVHNKAFMQGLGLKFLSQYDRPDANRIAKEFFKVIVVRNPFDRLVSTWRDMLVVRNSPARWKLGSAILAEYRDETHYELSKEWNDTVRFHEFARYLAEKSPENDQWAPYVSSCDVCMYKWNAVLRLETAHNDSAHFLSRFPGYSGGLPHLHSHTNAQQNIHQTQKRLPELNTLSAAAWDNLKYIYEADLEIFGYDWNSETNMTRCGIPTDDGDLCC